MMKAYDAIVLGAGPAGSTAALCLARRGWSVALVEKTPFPRSKVCGEFMSASNAAIFEDLGIADFIDAHAGPPIHRVGLFARDDALSAPMPQLGFDDAGWGRALGRDRLDSLLLDRARAAGADVWQPWSAVGLRRGPAMQICSLARRGEAVELAAPVVVAAHGSWDAGALPTQARRRAQPSDLLAFKAHFLDARLPGDLMPLIVFPGGYGGMATSDSGRVSLTLCIRRDALAGARAASDQAHAADAVFAHVSRWCRGVREALDGARLESGWLAVGPIHPGLRKPYENGVFRAGNCAGEAHPIVAEGISMALQSGWMLAERLAADEARLRAGASLDATGAAYARAWTAAFAPRIRAAAAFAHPSMRPRATDLLLPLVRRFPAILTWGARLSGKTHAAPDLQRPVRTQ